MANVIIPNGFVSSPTGLRSGQPARFNLLQQLNAQAMFLSGSFKHQHSCWVADDRGTGVMEADADVDDPLSFELRVPPYTRWIQWRVLTAGAGTVYVSRVGSARTFKLDVTNQAGNNSLRNSRWSQVDVVLETGTDVSACIDACNNTGDYATIEIEVYLDGSSVELYAVEFTFLRMTNAGADIVTT